MPASTTFVVTIFACCLIGLGSTLEIAATPQRFNQVWHETLNITCFKQGSTDSSTTQKVVAMQIGRPNEAPIARLHRSMRLTVRNDVKSKVQTEGHIEKRSGRSHLKISIRNPGLEDTGRYTCKLFYRGRKSERGDIDISLDRESQDIAPINDLVGKVKEQEAEILRLKLQQEKGVQNVGFSAMHLGGNIKGPGYMVFSEIQTNIGNAYNATTGNFTAPVAGLYAFHMHVTIVAPRFDSYAFSLRNRLFNDVANMIIIAKATSEQHAAMSVVLALEAEQVVRPYTYKPVVLVSDGYSEFSGYLVNPL